MAEIDEQVDRISNLPDALLSEILSFLSTKEAVATSILSKRWESVWTKVPVLNFLVDSDSVNGFEAFVDRVLICNDSHSLRLFKLCVSSFRQEIINEVKFHSWIRNIMRRDVVEIDLELLEGKLPSGTFSNEKLVVLKMSGFYSPLLNPIHLPNLLTLHFTSIDFTDEFSLNDILVRLPRLEELVINGCRVMQNSFICSSLRRLYIIRKFCFPRRKEKYIIVAAPSLEYLCIYGFSPHYEFCNMPSLAEARLHIRHSEDYDYYVKVLKQVSNLMILDLEFATEEDTIGDTEHDQQPLFPHLTHLIVRGYDRGSAKCSKFSWRHLVLWILKRAPNLVSLDYSSTYYDVLGEEELQGLPVLPSSLPKCPTPTLEVVNISLFHLADADKIFLEYLLNNAINLKVLKINLEGMVSGTTIAAIARLFKVPRASSICKLVISHQN